MIADLQYHRRRNRGRAALQRRVSVKKKSGLQPRWTYVGRRCSTESSKIQAPVGRPKIARHVSAGSAKEGVTESRRDDMEKTGDQCRRSGIKLVKQRVVIGDPDWTYSEGSSQPRASGGTLGLNVRLLPLDTGYGKAEFVVEHLLYLNLTQTNELVKICSCLIGLLENLDASIRQGLQLTQLHHFALVN